MRLENHKHLLEECGEEQSGKDYRKEDRAVLMRVSREGPGERYVTRDFREVSVPATESLMLSLETTPLCLASEECCKPTISFLRWLQSGFSSRGRCRRVGAGNKEKGRRPSCGHHPVSQSFQLLHNRLCGSARRDMSPSWPASPPWRSVYISVL